MRITTGGKAPRKLSAASTSTPATLCVTNTKRTSELSSTQDVPVTPAKKQRVARQATPSINSISVLGLSTQDSDNAIVAPTPASVLTVQGGNNATSVPISASGLTSQGSDDAIAAPTPVSLRSFDPALYDKYVVPSFRSSATRAKARVIELLKQHHVVITDPLHTDVRVSVSDVRARNGIANANIALVASLSSAFEDDE
jgi:hypothetical protein